MGRTPHLAQVCRGLCGTLDPPFCGIRTSVVGWLSIQCVCSPMSRQKKRLGDVLGHGLLQSLWDRYWGGLRRRCFRPPALGGWRGDGGCRVGLCRHGFLWGRGDSAGRARFRCAGTGVHTLWCPLCVCVCVCWRRCSCIYIVVCVCMSSPLGNINSGPGVGQTHVASPATVQQHP